jgi:hypothetical protein
MFDMANVLTETYRYFRLCVIYFIRVVWVTMW